VIIGDHIGEIGVARLQFEHHAVAATGADLGDIAEHGFGRRGGLLAQVMLDRRHHVMGVQGFAVVEGHAGPDFEGPDTCIGR
jgi:hypothetical protein